MQGDAAALLLEASTSPQWAGVQIAYVSRTEYPEWAFPALRTWKLPGHPEGASLADIADHFEIYPGSKITHFKKIRADSGLDYSDMLFFDNESWNVKEVSRLGVVSVYTPRGLTAADWARGLREYAASSSGSSSGSNSAAGSSRRSARG
jgi:magnesium-dependent phosphatase 1